MADFAANDEFGVVWRQQGVAAMRAGRLAQEAGKRGDTRAIGNLRMHVVLLSASNDAQATCGLWRLEDAFVILE
jgi:hypothetical protein